MCTSGCLTKDHATWGECVRAKRMRIAYCNSASGRDYSGQKRFDYALDSYAKARKEGIQPDSTNLTDVQRAVRISNEVGEAYGAAEFSG